jgi:DNA ligase-1
MAGVSIRHNNTEVFVGSGFTVEERIRYGADPSLIIGKEITVQCGYSRISCAPFTCSYSSTLPCADFGESHSAARAKDSDLSLRFPRVKKVWQDGVRDL